MVNSLISEILERKSKEKLELDWYSGKRILVTGGAGFIGSWLVEALVRVGSEVFVVDNLWRGSLENLRKEDGTYWIPLSSHFLLGDLRDYHVALSAGLKSKPDIVFHLADIVAGIDFVFTNEPFLFRANILINTNIFSAIQEVGIQRLVYLGTACSYPRKLQEKPGGIPLLEDQVYPADPESAYGWSKLMGEYESELLAKNSEIQVGILRSHNVYGPRSILSKKRSQVIPSLIRKAVRYPEEEFIVWGSGKQARDFVFVGDVVDAILRLPLKGMDKGVIQIGTAQETTVAELAAMIVEISGKEIPIRFDKDKPEGDRGRSGNYNKAKTILGWDVFTPLKDGLKQTYNWAYKQIEDKVVNLDE
jgi:nucleoside-diphosphate-sugar epimerase